MKLLTILALVIVTGCSTGTPTPAPTVTVTASPSTSVDPVQGAHDTGLTAAMAATLVYGTPDAGSANYDKWVAFVARTCRKYIDTVTTVPATVTQLAEECTQAALDTL